MFNINEKIYIKKLNKVGVIKEYEEGKYKVTYFDSDDKRKIEWFEFSEIRKLRNPLEIKVKYHTKDIPKLKKIATGDWIDLYVAEDTELKQFEFKLIPFGISIQLPKGYEANIVPRSSTFKNFGIIQANHYGVIDESYCGNDDQWMMTALALRDTKINKGDRIAQFRINKKMPRVYFTEVEDLGNKNRGGFGSTGIK